ncbi:hypothetical protein SLEP1_g26599 [Rubroshorea leprosula]|uniref:Uncharacterized protein n=1 Tax=Rubroshorea leprosula TaxID=152421 RepID=A0AAV5JYS3_9ROSI|nr:hypothetical protein SLEP1_g26599 [Rubroshorea leprosula]
MQRRRTKGSSNCLWKCGFVKVNQGKVLRKHKGCDSRMVVDTETAWTNEIEWGCKTRGEYGETLGIFLTPCPFVFVSF